MATAERKFYRTLIAVEVLSEAPFTSIDLEVIHEAITTGDCSGVVSVEDSEEVDGVKMAELLRAQGSDPDFFQLTDEGEDLEQEEMAPKERKVYTYKDYRVVLQNYTYDSGGRRAVELVDADDGEPVCRVTTNIPDLPLYKDEAFVKNWSENEGMLEWLVANKLAEDTGRWFRIGSVTAPVVKLLFPGDQP